MADGERKPIRLTTPPPRLTAMGLPAPVTPIDPARLRQRALEEAPSAFLIADAQNPDLPIVDVNAAFSSLTGYAREEVVGRNCRFLQGPETDPAAVHALVDSIVTGQAHPVTLLNYRADGAPFWNEVTISPLPEEGSNIRRLVGVQRDVTDRVEAIGLSAALAEEQDRQRLTSAVMRTLRHELKTPLSSICGYAELLLDPRSAPMSASQAADLAVILDNGRRLDLLLTAMLDLAQLRAGTLPLLREEVELTRLLGRLYAEFTPRAHARALELQFDVPALLAPICADNNRIHQALAHLLDNAIRFTDHGQVALVATDIVHQVQITITDTGRGMPQESLQQLFMGMISADHTLCREFDGLGIGGAIAAGIIAAHGGTISGESVPGEGTRIVIGLPASAAGVDCR